jgi:fused signal recognition particle receptor
VFGWGDKKKDAAALAQPPAADAPARGPGLFQRLFDGLRKSSSKITDGVTGALTKRRLDQAALDELEELLIAADLGAPAAARIVTQIAKDRFEKDVTEAQIKSALAEAVADILRPREALIDWSAPPRPQVILFVGVNGSGKTTTIGKIAANLSSAGRKVVIAAGDTFRAAAIDQLRVWAERSGAGFVARTPGADPAGLAFDAVAKARAEDADIVLIDTAGRLQNKAELMAELAKIIRVLNKLDIGAPHHVLLVLDATVGQNALSQVDAFRHAAAVTGLVMTKLDGTAKGGVLVAIAQAHGLPIHFIGVGESAQDLQPFDAEAFARALAGLDDAGSAPA